MLTIAQFTGHPRTSSSIASHLWQTQEAQTTSWLQRLLTESLCTFTLHSLRSWTIWSPSTATFSITIARLRSSTSSDSLSTIISTMMGSSEISLTSSPVCLTSLKSKEAAKNSIAIFPGWQALRTQFRTSILTTLMTCLRCLIFITKTKCSSLVKVSNSMSA